jgi:hypothetical protein
MPRRGWDSNGGRRNLQDDSRPRSGSMPHSTSGRVPPRGTQRVSWLGYGLRCALDLSVQVSCGGSGCRTAFKSFGFERALLNAHRE